MKETLNDGLGAILPPDIEGKTPEEAYLRGIWVGWQRGLDSHLDWGSSLGALVMGIVSNGLQRAHIDDATKKKVYQACSNVPIMRYEKQALKRG